MRAEETQSWRNQSAAGWTLEQRSQLKFSLAGRSKGSVLVTAPVAEGIKLLINDPSGVSTASLCFHCSNPKSRNPDFL